jgi:hypothetical protein
MKKLTIATLTSLICLTVFAQLQPEAPANLAAVMKAMSGSLKKISTQAADASQNAASEKLATELLDMTKNAKLHMPQSASSPDQQQQYIKMIDDLIVLEQDLVAAFHNNDNTGAASALTKLSASKKEGHIAFK